MSTPSAEEAKRRPVEITGYAIVSDDDKIAGPDGLVPPSLRNEKDWDHYQRALAGSDLIVFGHRSHELEPNVRGDQRVVVSRGADGLERRADAWWWNPARMSWAEVARRLLPQGGSVAVPGGQGVFDLFLNIGYDGFHLSRAHGVNLPGGQAVFSAVNEGLSAEDALTKAELRVSEKIPLDPEHGVEMEVWRAVRNNRDISESKNGVNGRALALQSRHRVRMDRISPIRENELFLPSLVAAAVRFARRTAPEDGARVRHDRRWTSPRP